MADSAFVKLTVPFEGTPITTIEWKGRPCWIAREVGRAIGYDDDGREFAKAISDEWSDEMIEGDDFMRFTGDDLRALRSGLGAIKGGISPLDPKVWQLLVIFESGLNLACMKTRKPLGKKLRRWLAEEVLPQIRRTGAYVAPDGELERRRLDLQARDLELRASEGLIQDAAFFESTGISRDVTRVLRVIAAEKRAGRPLPMLLPPADPDWIAATEIARQLSDETGIAFHRNHVGIAASALGLHGNIDGKAKVVMNKASNSDRTVEQYLYSPSAVEDLKARLRTNPPKPKKKHKAA